MNFKFRNKEYTVERDAHQFILTEHTTSKDGHVYESGHTYYSDPAFLIKKLIALHCISLENGKEMIKDIKTCCEELRIVLNNAIKAIPTDDIERSDGGQYSGSAK